MVQALGQDQYASHGRCFWYVQSRETHKEDQGHAGEIISPRKTGGGGWTCVLNLGKWKLMDEWMH